MLSYFLRRINKKYSVKMSSLYKKRIMLAVIDGNEEIETITISNILRRAENEVVLSKVRYNNDWKNQENLIVKLARGQKIVKINLKLKIIIQSKIADSLLDEEDHEKYDMIILPGGKLGAV